MCHKEPRPYMWSRWMGTSVFVIEHICGPSGEKKKDRCQNGSLPAKIILTTSFRSDFLYMSAFVRYNEKIIDNSE